MDTHSTLLLKPFLRLLDMRSPIRLFKVFICVMSLQLGCSLAGAATPDVPQIPFVRYDCLHRLLSGPWTDVWTSKWPDANRSLFDDSLRKIVEKDFETTVQTGDPYFKPWKTPLKIAAVKRNPKNDLIYFLLTPANDDQVLDGDIVYIYDPATKWWICKTTVDQSF